jgi:hypothetical protein
METLIKNTQILNSYIKRFEVEGINLDLFYTDDKRMTLIDYNNKILINSFYEPNKLQIYVKTFDYPEEIKSKIILLVVCCSLKLGFNGINDFVDLYDNNTVTSKSIISYTPICNFKEPENTRRYSFCKQQRSEFLNLINFLETIDYPKDKQRFTDLVYKIIQPLYTKTSPNKSYGVNYFIEHYLNTYTDLYLIDKKCFLGSMTLKGNEIFFQSPKNLLNKLMLCKTRGIIKLVIEDVHGNNHANHLVIENGEVWKIEPNYILEPLHWEPIVDKGLTDYFKKIGIPFKGNYYNSCGLEHFGLCAFISSFSMVFGKQLNDQLLKDTIIDFLRWLIKRICSNWNTVREKIL